MGRTLQCFAVGFQRSRTAAAVAVVVAALLGGCAAGTPLGRTERLPEGTLPPAREVGPAVNIQPAPLGRPDYRPPPHPGAWGYGYRHAPGWYGPRCIDPFFCGPNWFWGGPSFYYGVPPRGRPGFGLHYRLF